MYFGTDNQGYSRGGIDVTTAVNLFFKFLLLSPVFLLAGYVSIAMMKHMIFHGVPVMNAPTEAQVEQLRERDESIGMTNPEPAPVVLPAPDPVWPQEESSIVSQGAPRVRSTVLTAAEKAENRKAVLQEYCVTTWIPKYGNNPNAFPSPCEEWM